MPRTAGRPYDTAIGLVSCEMRWLLHAWFQGQHRFFELFRVLFLLAAIINLADGDSCKVQFDQTRFGRPGVYTNIAQLKRWVKANLACLAQGKICPWGGTW